jgi:hypothetical protein
MIYKPSTQFTYLLSSIAEVINDLFQRAENINNIKETTDTIKKSLPNIAPKETPEQELNRLMNELPKTNDKELRKKMFKRMSELNAEIGD